MSAEEYLLFLPLLIYGLVLSRLLGEWRRRHTDAAAWAYWFDQLLVGHFLSARVELTSSSGVGR